jgi:predicted secreted protein
MKKIIFACLALSLALSLAGCGGKPATVDTNANANINISEVPETGRIIDASALNGQTVTTTPGDIIDIKLTGDNGKQYQWNFSSIDAADYVSLKNHEVSNANQPAGSKFVSDWQLKIQKTGSFNLQFDYSRMSKKPEKSFKLQVVSQ